MPVVSLKSITRITLAHGPGQFSGGAYWNGLMLKSANSRFEKSWTTQGFSFGCDTGGSAVAVLPEPITKLPEFCAAAEEPNNSIEKSIAITAKAKNNPPILGTRIMADLLVRMRRSRGGRRCESISSAQNYFKKN